MLLSLNKKCLALSSKVTSLCSKDDDWSNLLMNSFSLSVKGDKVINEVTVLSGQSQTKLIKWRALRRTGCWLLHFHIHWLQAVMLSLWDSSERNNQKGTGLVCRFWAGLQISHTNGMNMVREVAVHIQTHWGSVYILVFKWHFKWNSRMPVLLLSNVTL